MTRISELSRRSPLSTQAPGRVAEVPRQSLLQVRDGFDTRTRPVEPVESPPMTRMLRRRHQGEDVKQLQQKLKDAGFDPGDIDGKFGPRTEAALRAFQQANGLRVDGRAGEETFRALGLEYIGRRAQTPAGGATDGSGTPAGGAVDGAGGGTPAGGAAEAPSGTTGAQGPTPTSDVGGIEERRAIARRLVKPGGSGTQEDVDAVVAELEKLPLAQLQQLERQGTTVVACRDSVADHRTDLANVQPRGWPPGSSWSQVPGAYAPNNNEVIIATTSGPNGTRAVPATGQGHGSANIVAHEVGHALDQGAGRPSMNDPEFQRAYQADYAGLAPYLQQPGEAGPSEAYAESLAMYLSNPDELRRKHPALAAYWDTKFNER
ncbi:MAG: peptidoglycan-binding protein [Myxococcaceae bacterium]|nr:peptidoglycan-binding protein [Myxococcaceae bacterium]